MMKGTKKKEKFLHPKNQEHEVEESSVYDQHKEEDIQMNGSLSNHDSEPFIGNLLDQNQNVRKFNCQALDNFSEYYDEIDTNAYSVHSQGLNRSDSTREMSELLGKCFKSRNEGYYKSNEFPDIISNPITVEINRMKTANRKSIIKIHNGCRYFKNQKNVCPKSNYYRYRLIRVFKKYLRTGKIPRKYRKRNYSRCINIVTLLHSLREHRKSIKHIIAKVAPTEYGPLTDGKSKRQHIEEVEEKTMNNSFVKKFFSEPEVFECYKKYILVIFADKTPDELSAQFGFRCCKKRLHHSMDCYKNWKYLEFYSYTGLICSPYRD